MQTRRLLGCIGAGALLSTVVFASSQTLDKQKTQEATGILLGQIEQLEKSHASMAEAPPNSLFASETIRTVGATLAELYKARQQPNDAFRLISQALERFPAIQLDSLEWRTGSNATTAATRPSGQSIVVRGTISIGPTAPARQAAEYFGEFVRSLQTSPADQVEVLQQPFDFSSGHLPDASNDAQPSRAFSIRIARGLTA